MIAYASRTGTKKTLAAMRAAGWRVLISAEGVHSSEGFQYAIDNGAWTAHQKDVPFNHAKFVSVVAKLGCDADWVAAPDIVMGGFESLTTSLAWLPLLLKVTKRVLIPVQDGVEPKHLSKHLGPRVGIFIGGSTEWKESSMQMWGEASRDFGCWLHVGRVNTMRRIAMCGEAGAHSFDGTSVTRFGAGNLPRLERARYAAEQHSKHFRASVQGHLL